MCRKVETRIRSEIHDEAILWGVVNDILKSLYFIQ